MIKKILYYSLIMIGFALCFIFGKGKINILAMGNFDNSIGTIPIQMDIDNYNYNSNNLFNINDYILDSSGAIGFNANNLIINETYTFSSNKPIVTFKISPTRYGYSCTVKDTYDGFDKFTFNMCLSDNYEPNTKQYIFIWLFEIDAYVSDISQLNGYDISIVKGSNALPYEPFYQFGYLANLSYSINTSSNTTVNYYFNEYTYTKTTSSGDNGYLLENYYLPFNIDSKGYVSFPNINFGISSISNSTSSNMYSLQLELTPVFNAYYKGEYTTNIYTKLNYMSNDLFFSGITFSGCKSTSCNNTINAGNLSLTNPKTLAVTELNDTGNISTTNISTYYNDDIKNRNYFEYNNYLNVGFRIGNLAENYNKMNGINYTFGISSLASRIVDNQTTTTPLPDNELTTDKYNTCSAWYDIPCQLGNAITYVIYEAPIISPILSFINVFITMFSSLVSFVDLFKSFGILFGCFVIYMFVELLHKYSK